MIEVRENDIEEALASVTREIGLRGRFYDFVPLAWPIVEPSTPFLDNWHIGAVCEHLEAVSEGQIRNLGINIPPGCMKSLLVEVFWDVWEWIRRPGTKLISASFDADLTLRDARKVLAIMQSPWFVKSFGDRVQVPNECAASDFVNLQGGFRFSTSVKGKLTGRHCDIFKIDDPHKPLAISKVSLDEVKQWASGTVPTRFADPKKGRKVLIMQRLHEEDLSGYYGREEGWEWLRLPMRFEPKACSYTSVGGDPRMTDGELLWPERFDEKEVARLEKELGSRESAAQLQQRPAPKEGAIFKLAWFKYYKVPPARFDQIIQSWDCAFKDTDGSDYVAGQVWGAKGADYYLLYRVKERLDFPGTIAAIEKAKRLYPKSTAILVEDKANGPAVISTLKKKIPGLIAVEPDGGKQARASAVAPIVEAGNVYLPDPESCPWTDELTTELTTFPFSSNDDETDSLSQALNYLYQKAVSYRKAMANAKGFFA